MTSDPSPAKIDAVARSYVRARRLGIALRDYRKAAGYTLENAADELGMSVPTLSRIETANTIARPVDVRRMLSLYDVAAEDIARYVQIAKDARSKGEWWRSYDLPGRVADLVALESDAISISVYRIDIVPGLAQTEAYCRALMADVTPVVMSEAEINEWVEFRMRRQRRILEDDDAPQVSIIVDDSVLARVVGGHGVMNEQIDHLITLGDRPNITVQIVPVADGAHPGIPGPVTFLDFDDLMPASVYIDTIFGDALFDGSAEVQRTRQALDAVRARAATPEDSRNLLVAAKK